MSLASESIFIRAPSTLLNVITKWWKGIRTYRVLQQIPYHCQRKEGRIGRGRSLLQSRKLISSLGCFKQGSEFRQKDLAITKEIGDRTTEGRAYSNLDIAYQCLGKL